MLEHFNYETIINQLLRTEAEVSIKPHIKHEKPKIFCIESDIQPWHGYIETEGEKTEKADGKYYFAVTQVFCVEIPISVDIDVDVDNEKIHCYRPDSEPYKLEEFLEPPIHHEVKEPAKFNVINLRYLRFSQPKEPPKVE